MSGHKSDTTVAITTHPPTIDANGTHCTTCRKPAQESVELQEGDWKIVVKHLDEGAR